YTLAAADGSLIGATSNAFAIIPPVPTVASFTPTAGPGGATVTISGADFTGATAVTFGGANAASFTVNSATQITAVAPNHVPIGPITVTTLGGTGTSAASFAVTVAFEAFVTGA